MGQAVERFRVAVRTDFDAAGGLDVGDDAPAGSRASRLINAAGPSRRACPPSALRSSARTAARRRRRHRRGKRTPLTRSTAARRARMGSASIGAVSGGAGAVGCRSGQPLRLKVLQPQGLPFRRTLEAAAPVLVERALRRSREPSVRVSAGPGRGERGGRHPERRFRVQGATARGGRSQETVSPRSRPTARRPGLRPPIRGEPTHR